MHFATPQPAAQASTNDKVCAPCSALMGAHADLRAAALLALTKLMCIEPAFCDAHLRLLFTLLQNRCAPRLPSCAHIAGKQCHGLAG